MFTLDFERETRLSLPISANTLRVLGESRSAFATCPG